MSKTPIYVLQSKKTGSAAEAFAMRFRSTGRGLLVGDNTNKGKYY